MNSLKVTLYNNAERHELVVTIDELLRSGRLTLPAVLEAQRKLQSDAQPVDSVENPSAEGSHGMWRYTVEKVADGKR